MTDWGPMSDRATVRTRLAAEIGTLRKEAPERVALLTVGSLTAAERRAVANAAAALA